jgi:hypothetical protein
VVLALVSVLGIVLEVGVTVVSEGVEGPINETVASPEVQFSLDATIAMVSAESEGIVAEAVLY